MTDIIPTATPPAIDEPGLGRVQCWPLPTDEDTLWLLLKEVFQQYWQDIHFGTLVPGAVWEVRAPNAPVKVSLLDGYATVDFGAWHFHLCIGHFSGALAISAVPARRTPRNAVPGAPSFTACWAATARQNPGGCACSR